LPSRRNAPAFAVAAGVGAAIWVGLAYLLWATTTVPSDLSLPSLDPQDFFTDAELAAAHSYERFLRVEFLVAQLLAIGVLVAYARWGTRFLKESAAGRIGSGMLLAMLGLGFVWLTLLPAGIVDLWWQRRHDLTKANYADYVFGSWGALGAEFLAVSLAIVIVMGLAGLFRTWWWIPGAFVFVALAGLQAFVYPYLVPSSPLEDPALAADAERYARAQGIDPVEIRVVEVSTFTTAPNAEAAGLGPSRRIFFWDTILDGRFDRKELDVVLAHELGHQSRNHIPKGLAWYALLALPGAFLIAVVTRRRGGMREPEAVPLALLVLVAGSIAVLPLENAVTRHIEAEADWVALETTKDPDAAVRLFEGFSTELLAEPKPPTWAYVMTETHPTIIQRLAMAEAWKERQAAGAGP
jgi:STE24 endopeptidase